MQTKYRRPLNFCNGRFGLYLFGLFITASLAGCPDQSIDDAVITVDHYCKDMADIFCSVVVPCCSDTSDAMDSESCIEMIKSECEDVERYSDSFDSRLAARCLDAINTYLYYECKLPEDRSFDGAGCTGVFSGQADIDEECESDYQCAYSPEGDSVCKQGVCEVIDWAKKNEPCGEAYPSCESGLFCDIESGKCSTDQPALEERKCLYFEDGHVRELFR